VLPGPGLGRGHVAASLAPSPFSSPSAASSLAASSLASLAICNLISLVIRGAGAGIRVTGKVAVSFVLRLFALICSAFWLAKSSSLPRISQRAELSSARGCGGGRRRTVCADTSGGGRWREREKGLNDSKADQRRLVAAGEGGRVASDFEDMDFELAEMDFASSLLLAVAVVGG
jgi:hypothetical protein